MFCPPVNLYNSCPFSPQAMTPGSGHPGSSQPGVAMTTVGYPHGPPPSICTAGPPPTPHGAMGGYQSILPKDPNLMSPLPPVSMPPESGTSPGQLPTAPTSGESPAEGSPTKKKRTYKRRKKSEKDSPGAEGVEGTTTAEGQAKTGENTTPPKSEGAAKKRKPRKKKVPADAPAAVEGAENSSATVATTVIPAVTAATNANEGCVSGEPTATLLSNEGATSPKPATVLGVDVSDSAASGDVSGEKKETAESESGCATEGEKEKKETPKRPSRAGAGSKRKRPLPNLIKKRKRVKRASGMPGSDSDGDVGGGAAGGSEDADKVEYFFNYLFRLER